MDIIYKTKKCSNLKFIGYLTDIITNNNFNIIIETGSGWGNYIFNIYMYILKNKNNNIFYSLEYSDIGLECNNLLTQKINNDINVHFFDYYVPDLKFVLNKKNDNIFMYSIHSIEQVTILNIQYFYYLLNKFEKLTYLHIEPVGWQSSFTDVSSTFKNLTSTYMNVENIIERNKKEYKRCNKAKYNNNLLSILSILEKENKIKINKYITYGPSNKSAVIIWEKNNSV